MAEFPEISVVRINNGASNFFKVYFDGKLVIEKIRLKDLGRALSQMLCDGIRNEYSARVALTKLTEFLISANNAGIMETVRARRYAGMVEEENEELRKQLEQMKRRAEDAERLVRNLNLWIEIKGIDSYNSEVTAK